SVATSSPTRTAASFDNEGLILRAAGRDAEAERAFAAALALAPRDPSPAWNLSELLRQRTAARDRSDELLLQAVANGLPAGGDALAGRAMGYASVGEAGRAQGLAARGTALLPADPRLWLLAGRLHLEREECRPALAAFRRAAALAPERAETHAAVGIAALCLGDEAAARDALRRSLALDPEQPQLRRQLSELGG
ncbi:MAG TPA: hypothetical protein VGV61_19085, partial [Thermoanaerobaculia bacterium]|nr:hypothetical protein [Thermoanaerobaculia bacterium]